MNFFMDDCMDDCMDVVLGDTQVNGDVMLHYLFVCHDDVINLGYGFLCGDVEWPSRTGVLFQTLPAMFEFSTPLLHHAV